jgi:hypothetical protein
VSRVFLLVRIAAAGGLVLCCFLGCVRTDHRKEALSKTALMVGRDGTGTTLQWKSRKDERYTIMYREGKSPGARWLPLPQATEIVGTGETMVVKDTSPGAFYRSYRPQALIAVPADKIPKTKR